VASTAHEPATREAHAGAHRDRGAW
jgi:hypothetical protein